mgnify:CR=1 FL=1
MSIETFPITTLGGAAAAVVDKLGKDMADGDPRQISAERLKRLLSYDPESGQFTWLAREVRNHFDRIWNTRYAGTIPNYRNSYGYILISIDGRRHFAHRLAWLYMTGAWPKDDIDHINLQRDDNRWCNLREATRSENKANTSLSAANKSGIKGVHWHRKYQKWHANIKVRGKAFFLGSFSTAEEAREAYEAAARKHFGEFARTRS